MKILIFLLLAAMLSGCTSNTITTPEGWRWKRVSFMQKHEIKHVEFTAPNGVKAVLDGYANDGGAQTMQAALELFKEGMKIGAASQGIPLK